MDQENTKNFIELIIDKDNETGKYGERVHTRFPPNRTGICTSDTPSPFASTSA